MANRLNLTDATVRGLSHDGVRPRQWTSTTVEGLTIRVARSGLKVWSVRGPKLDQKMGRMEKLGEWPELASKDAHDMARTMRAVAGLGPHPKPVARKRGRVATRGMAQHADAAFRWHQKAGSWSDRQRANMASAWKWMERGTDPIGDRPASDITPADWTRFFNQLERDGKRYKGPRKAASAVYEYMMDRKLGGVESNPTKGLTVKQPSRDTRKVSLDHAGVALFWRAMDTLGIQVGGFGRLALLTGARPLQLTRMRWDDVDVDRRLWTPRGDTGKKRQVPMPLSHAALDVLESLRGLDAKYVFPGNGWESPHQRPHMGVPRTLANQVKRDLDFQIKDLRKTFATTSVLPLEDTMDWYTGAGCAVDIVDILMGHATRSMRTKAYDTNPAAALWKERLEVMDQWAAYVEACVAEANRAGMAVA